MIVIGTVVVVMVSILSFIMMENGKRVLNERLIAICNLSIRNLSQTIKDDLLFYYRDFDDPNLKSLYIGRFLEGVLEVQKLNISGLQYACILDREGNVLAQTVPELIDKQLSAKDRLSLLSLQETESRESEELYEYYHPIWVATGENNGDNRVLLGMVVLGFSKEIIMQPIRQISNAILIAVIMIAMASMIVIYVVARKMTAQIDALVGGAREVGKGNLRIEIPIISRDELGSLAYEFNRMINHLREKLHMQKFLSSLTVQMIRKKSNSYELPPEGERRQVTLVFSDIRDFTAMTEKLTPEETVALINVYLDLQSRVIEENGGVVDKFMGDQVMAIFLGKTMADDAVHASVEIQRSIRELNKRRGRKKQVILNVGVGMNDGMVVMGNMGSRNRLDYTVIGDAVNLAARLCSIARQGQIIAPISIAESLTNAYPTIRLEPVMVKGRSQPVDIFEIDYDRAIIM
jgi:class 3 adenylate cyclase